MKKLLFLLSLILSILAVDAQEQISIVFGSINKPFDGYIGISVRKDGKLRKYADNRLYSHSRRYAIAVPAAEGDTVQVYFIRNNSRSNIFNDTIHTAVYNLKSASKINLDLNYQAATTKYIASKATQSPFSKIVPADSLALVICSFDQENLINSKLLTTRNMMPEETAILYAYFDKKASHHIMAVAINKPALYDLECAKLKYRVYAKPGETLQFHITGNTTATIDYTLENASAENKALKQWFDYSRPVTRYGYFIRMFEKDLPAPEAFMGSYNQLKQDIPAKLASIATGNTAFNNMLKSLMPFDLDLGALNYLSRLNQLSIASDYAGSYNGLKVLPEAMKALTQSTTICDSKIVALYDYHNYVHAFANLWEAMYPNTTQPVTKEPGLNKWQMEHMCTKEAKSVYLYIELLRFKRVCSNRYDFNVKFAPFKDYLLTKEMRTTYNEVKDKYSKEALMLNAQISEALLPNSKGNMINVGTAFKGKVVLFDIWGTWCGPCRAQIPYWKALADEYKDNPNVVFVGIAYQQNSPYWIAEWKKVIRESDFPGLHLIDVEGERFYKPLNIASPCYMLLGKDGKWIENRCPKPEYKDKLKAMIDKALAAE